jgi:hypothetical protein
MKLRIANNGQGLYWVEQKRWYGGWKICNKSDSLYDLERFKSIRFIGKKEEDSFHTYDEALRFSKMWWEAYSLTARKIRKRSKELKWGNINYKTFTTADFVKEKTIDSLKE